MARTKFFVLRPWCAVVGRVVSFIILRKGQKFVFRAFFFCTNAVAAHHCRSLFFFPFFFSFRSGWLLSVRRSFVKTHLFFAARYLNSFLPFFPSFLFFFSALFFPCYFVCSRVARFFFFVMWFSYSPRTLTRVFPVRSQIANYFLVGPVWDRSLRKKFFLRLGNIQVFWKCWPIIVVVKLIRYRRFRSGFPYWENFQ